MIKQTLQLTACALLVLTALPAFAVDDTAACEGIEGSSRLEACLHMEEVTTLDEAIATALVSIARMGTEADKAHIDDSQRSFEQYRDKVCWVQQRVMGGLNSVSVARCMAVLTRQRLVYLKESFML